MSIRGNGPFESDEARNVRDEHLAKLVNMPGKRQRRSFLAWIERAGDGLELGIRCVIGLAFGLLFAGLGYSVGGYFWTGLGVLLSIGAAPLGFVLGFFWNEIKVVLKIVVKAIMGL